jgi:phage replication-related protein YjqB (UPF0714/DUF867 family)
VPLLTEVEASVANGVDLDERGERIEVSRSVLHDLGLRRPQKTVAGSRMQVRVVRRSEQLGSHHDVLYTVAQISPGTGHEIRMGQKAQARIARGATERVRVTQHVLYADLKQSYHVAPGAQVAVLAPHGGQLEDPTEIQLNRVVRDPRFSASRWACLGQGGDEDKRLHITSDDLSEHSFSGLGALLAVRHRYAVSFHGFKTVPNGYQVIVGGGADETDKKFRDDVAAGIKNQLKPLGVAPGLVYVPELSTEQFAGMARGNVVNRVATAGVQIEQSRALRNRPGAPDAVAAAVADVLVARLSQKS